jgi:hypothetical protein
MQTKTEVLERGNALSKRWCRNCTKHDRPTKRQQQQQKKPRRIKPGQGCLASLVSVGVATHASILTTPKSMPRVAGALNDYDYSRAICRGRALGDLSLMRS